MFEKRDSYSKGKKQKELKVRKKSRVKLLSMLLCLCMLTMMFAGCKSQNTGAEGEGEKPTISADGNRGGADDSNPSGKGGAEDSNPSGKGGTEDSNPSGKGGAEDPKPAGKEGVVDTNPVGKDGNKDGLVLAENGFSFTGKSSVDFFDAKLPEGFQDAVLAPKGNAAQKLSVGTDTAFLLTTTKEVTEAEIQSYVHFLPETKFAVSRETETTYTIQPETKLNNGMLYRMVIGDTENPYQSFAFQTETDFMITEMFPRDKSTQVPINTGIEVSFSEALSADCNIKDFITISPSVEGEFQSYPNGKSFAFVPKKDLKQNTVYTITVNKGIRGISGRSLSEGRTVEFRTDMDTLDQDRKVVISLDSQQQTLTTEEEAALFFRMSYQNEKTPVLKPAEVTVFAYENAAAAIEAMKTYELQKESEIFTEKGYVYPSEGLKKVDELSIPVQSPGRWERGVISFPKLPEGCYLLNLKMAGDLDGVTFETEKQVLLQITNLSVYTENAGEKLLVFVNDHTKVISSLNGVELQSFPAGGAKIEADCFTQNDYWSVEKTEGFRRISASTDGDGVAVMTVEKENAAFLLVSCNGKESYVCASVYGNNDETEFLSYLYSDREVYFSNDTVHFFGMIAPKKEQGKLPKELFLRLYSSAQSVKIPVAADGTFEGSFAIEDFMGYGISYRLEDAEGKTAAASFVRVTQDEKPVYKAEITFDKLFYKQNDTMKITVKSTFYDGTPVPGLAFDLTVSSFLNGEERVITGPDGTASLEVKTKIMNRQTTDPDRIFVYATLMGEEDTTLCVDASVLYFQSGRVFEVNRVISEKGEDTYTEVKLHERTFEQIKSEDDLNYPDFPENTIGAPVEENVAVILEKIEYIKEIDSTYYDPISRTRRNRYNYTTQRTVLKDYSEKTENGILKLGHIKEEKGFDGYYQYSISYFDKTTNQTCKATSYASAGRNGWYEREKESYFITVNEGPFDLQDTVNCKLMYGQEEIRDVPVLYTVYTDQLLQYKVARNGEYPFAFTKDMMLGAQINATVVRGGQITQMNSSTIRYNFEKNNQLSVTVETDKEKYKPGEEAKVTVQLKDQNGLPVSGQCVLSIVDEACFALGEQTIEPLAFFREQDRYYFSINRNGRFCCVGGLDPYSYMYTNKSGMKDVAYMEDNAIEATGAADNGRGGETVTVRETFLDNPVFQLVTAGADGTAKTTIKIPDNITTWRLSSVAVQKTGASYDTVAVGTGISKMIATLPFFVNAEIGSTFLDGDDISASARIYGSELSEGTKVTYLAEVFGEGEKSLKVIETEAVSGEQAWFSFGKLPEGDYTLVVKAVTDKASDGVKLWFSVVESAAVMNVRKELSLSELKTIAPMKYPVRLTFYQEAYDGYLQAVNSLFSGYSNRFDSSAAYYIGAVCSEKLFGGENGFSSECDEIKKKFAQTYGLIPKYTYGEGDLLLSARIAAAAPEVLTESKKEELVTAFSDYLMRDSYESAEKLTAALLGMAALKQPVLSELTYVASHSDGFSLSAMLNLTAAFAYLGDFNAAGELYDSLSKQYLRQGEGNELYFEGAATEENIRYTAEALFSAALIRKKEAEGLYAYLSTHHSTLDLYCLEKAAYVKYFYPEEMKKAELTYKIGEKTETVTLEPAAPFCLVLNKQDFKDLQIVKADEKIRVRAAYLGSAEEGKKLQNATLQKTITAADKEKDIYKVTISYTITTDRNFAYFELSDYLPSGTRYLRPVYESKSWNEKDWSSSAYLSNIGQQMRGSVYVFNHQEDKLSGLQPVTVSGSVSYLIRGAALGDYVVDNAYLKDYSSEATAVSNKGMITIEENGWKINLQ